MTDLSKFREAKALRWNRWTGFKPGSGTDGTLYADDGSGVPLDTWTEKEAIIELARSPSRVRTAEPRIVTLPGGVRVLPAADEKAQRNQIVGIIADPACLRELHETIRSWARDVLGRDDVQFTVRTPDGRFETVEPVPEP